MGICLAMGNGSDDGGGVLGSVLGGVLGSVLGSVLGGVLGVWGAAMFGCMGVG